MRSCVLRTNDRAGFVTTLHPVVTFDPSKVTKSGWRPSQQGRSAPRPCARTSALLCAPASMAAYSVGRKLYQVALCPLLLAQRGPGKPARLCHRVSPAVLGTFAAQKYRQVQDRQSPALSCVADTAVRFSPSVFACGESTSLVRGRQNIYPLSRRCRQLSRRESQA